MRTPDFNKESTSRIYAELLSRLDQACPDLDLANHLLLPASDTYINGVKLYKRVSEFEMQTEYGKLEHIFVFQYKCDLTFDFHGVMKQLTVDYRRPRDSFTDAFMETFEIHGLHQYVDLYWETGGSPYGGSQHNYSLCKVCLEKKRAIYQVGGRSKSLTSKLLGLFK